MSEQENGLIYVHAYFDHQAVGSGYRRLVIEHGRKWATLCEPPTATVFRMERHQLPRSMQEVPNPNWKRLARTMRRRLKDQKRWGWHTTQTQKDFCAKMAAAHL